jgi:3-oxoacyl-[acyl-carrier-protein] synthase-3
MPSVPSSARGGVITGWGTALPATVLSNHDLAARGLETSDEWIVERTGIRERRIIGIPGEGVDGSTASLSIEAGRKAIEMAGLDPHQIDALVLSTTTPDRSVPATSATVQHGLGLRCGSFDVNAACSGFTYAMVVAHGLIAMGSERVLVIGTDTLSRITDWEDRNTAVLFADGSGAVVIEAVEGRGQLRGWDLDADGSAEEYLYAPLGGTLYMEGKEVFRRAVRIMVDSAEKSMKAAGVTADEIALVVPHQANVRIIKAACDRLGIEMDRASVVLDRTGNTSSASIPLALADALDTGKVTEGDLVLMVGFGAGMTAASTIIEWCGRGVVARTPTR